MKKKRLGKALAALGLCVSMAGTLAGCGKNAAPQNPSAGSDTPAESSSPQEDKEETVEITYWYWEDEQGTIENMLKDKWEAYAGDRIKVKFESIPSSSFHDKLITAVSTGTGPDVFICKPMWAPELHGMGGLAKADVR